MTPQGHDSRRTKGHSNTLPASATPSVRSQESRGEFSTAHSTPDTHFLPQVGRAGEKKKGPRDLEVEGTLQLAMPRGPSGLQPADSSAPPCPGSWGTRPACPGRKPCQSNCPMLGPRIYSRDLYHPRTEAAKGANPFTYSTCNSHNLRFRSLPAGWYSEQQLTEAVILSAQKRHFYSQ